MDMKNEKLQEYAKLLIEVGLHVQKGQTLVISSPVECAYFARLCATAAYDVGCREVVMNWHDDAMARLKALTSLPFTLVLAGDGPLLEGAKQQAQTLGLGENVRFLGFRQDMKNLYRGADLCVCPSQQEALSFFLIESMACGLPVVATDVGGNSDIVNPAAGDGLLVPYGDADALAAAVARMMEDGAFRRQCSENALRTVHEKFEIHGWVEKTMDAYRAALARKETL